MILEDYFTPLLAYLCITWPFREAKNIDRDVGAQSVIDLFGLRMIINEH